MKSKFIAKVLFLLAALALSPALRKMEICAQTSAASKQDQPSGTLKQAKIVLTTDPSRANDLSRQGSHQSECTEDFQRCTETSPRASPKIKPPTTKFSEESKDGESYRATTKTVRFGPIARE